MKRLKIAFCIALIGTVISIVGFLLGTLNVEKFAFAYDLIFLGMLVGWVAYIFGGLGTAIKMALGIAKWGWFILPFPIDLISFPFTVLIALYVLLCLPIIPITKAYLDNRY